MKNEYLYINIAEIQLFMNKYSKQIDWGLCSEKAHEFDV